MFFQHVEPLYYLAVLGPAELGDFLFWLVIFFGVLLLLNLQIELNGIHKIVHSFNLVDLPSLVTEAPWMERLTRRAIVMITKRIIWYDFIDFLKRV